MKELTRLEGSICEGAYMDLIVILGRRGLFMEALTFENEIAEKFPQSQPSETYYEIVANAMTRPCFGVVGWRNFFKLTQRMEERGIALTDSMCQNVLNRVLK